MTSTISILNQQLSFEKITSLDNYKDNLYPEKLVFEKMVIVLNLLFQRYGVFLVLIESLNPFTVLVINFTTPQTHKNL